MNRKTLRVTKQDGRYTLREWNGNGKLHAVTQAPRAQMIADYITAHYPPGQHVRWFVGSSVRRSALGYVDSVMQSGDRTGIHSKGGNL